MIEPNRYSLGLVYWISVNPIVIVVEPSSVKLCGTCFRTIMCHIITGYYLVQTAGTREVNAADAKLIITRRSLGMW